MVGSESMKVWSKQTQSGLTLTGLIFMVAVVGLIAVLGLRIVPSVTEYMAVKKAIVSAKSAGNTPQEIRAAFDRQADVGYIQSITSKDLDISKENDVSFAYQKVIHLAGPASLVLDYEGSTAKNRPAKAADK
jgi:Tfp pilus assembly protein PilE